MQLSEMRALRTLYSQKHLLNPTRRTPGKPSSLALCKSSQNPHVPHHRTRLIHSTSGRHSEESSPKVDGPKGWSSSSSWIINNNSMESDENATIFTVYNPVSGQLAAQRGIEGSDIQEPEPNSSEKGEISRERSNGNFGKVNSVGGYREIVRNKKKGKSKVCWVCADCGHSDGQWWGTCRACNSVGTMKQFSPGEDRGGGVSTSGFEVSESKVRSWLLPQPDKMRPIRLTEVNRGDDQLDWRIPLPGLFGTEVARVLGGGLVPGSLVLVGGDPGVGKSTLLLQIAAMIAEGCGFNAPAPVLYVSGEESVEQIGNRADRMKIGTGELFLYSSTDIEDILEKIQHVSPRALVVDSIQTVYLKGVTGSAGGLSQVKECTSALLRFAKKTNIPVLLIGHVTKSGDIAGPRVLEHIVDVVLYMELGVFEMSQSGLQAVMNPSEIFLSEQHPDSDCLAGLAVAVIMDGSRAFLLEIQALCLSGSSVARHTNGVQASRADMIISVLMKQAGLKLQENAIFLNVVSGVTMSETAGDLAIAAAICSSFLEFPIPCTVAFIGEIGLGGELRMVPRMEKRVSTLAKLGYRKCIVPKSAEKHLAAVDFGELKIVGCRNLKEGTVSPVIGHDEWQRLTYKYIPSPTFTNLMEFGWFRVEHVFVLRN
ncbi:uncharacterized protein LOC131164415 isoform X2 [Malania oleifera]|uniref:uncharacterized protein LOC131164415 isoform X2 n=1 Tax=Malania oleifera TaxID=397392 RepID=UPI0025ADF15F|nr:uncharacterized protein LOC131164415 isoform X2 [Malania oleifera]